MTRPYKLTPQQIETLRILYKFRFITAQLLAQYRQLKNHRSARLNLETLVSSGYVLKRYDSSYKIAMQPAVYGLTSQGLNYLKAAYDFNQAVPHNMYKNKIVTKPFADEHLAIVKLFLSLRAQNPEQFELFGSIELVDEDEFPETRPELYLRRIEPQADFADEYFLYVIDDAQLFIIKQRLKTWMSHYDSIGWDGDYPTILLVCRTQSIENRTRTYLMSLGLDDDIHILTTTTSALLQSDDGKIWSSYEEDEPVLVSLS